MKFCFAEPHRLKEWIEVARDVGKLMRNPAMDTDPLFLDYAKRKLVQNDAIMAYDNEKELYAGFIGFSRHNNSITWLGVKEGFRNTGIGSGLLTRSLNQLNRELRITVNTYPEHYIPGHPARRLYLKHGFVETINESFYIDGYEMAEFYLEPFKL